MAISWILFDLGNVRVDYRPGGIARMEEALGIEEGELSFFLSEDDIFQKMETGLLPPGEFAARINDRFRRRVTPEEIVAWFGPEISFVYPEIPPLLRLFGRGIPWAFSPTRSFFILHKAFNWSWIKAVTKSFFGEAAGAARLNYVVDLFLLAGMTATVLSGAKIAKTIDFSWLPFGGGMIFWRFLHLSGAVLTLAMAGIHVGLHWKWVGKTAGALFCGKRRTAAGKLRSTLLSMLGVAFLATGAYGISASDFFAKASRVFTAASMEMPPRPSENNGFGDAEGLPGGKGGVGPQGRFPAKGLDPRDGLRPRGGHESEPPSGPPGVPAMRRSFVSLGNVLRYFLVFAFFVSGTAWIVKCGDVLRRRKLHGQSVEEECG